MERMPRAVGSVGIPHTPYHRPHPVSPFRAHTTLPNIHHSSILYPFLPNIGKTIDGWIPGNVEGASSEWSETNELSGVKGMNGAVRAQRGVVGRSDQRARVVSPRGTEVER